MTNVEIVQFLKRELPQGWVVYLTPRRDIRVHLVNRPQRYLVATWVEGKISMNCQSPNIVNRLFFKIAKTTKQPCVKYSGAGGHYVEITPSENVLKIT